MTDWQAFVNIILKQTLRKLDYQQKISHRRKKFYSIIQIIVWNQLAYYSFKTYLYKNIMHF